MTIEFNTYEDLTTVVSYKQHEQVLMGDYTPITVDICEVAAIHEGWCKLFAMVLLDDCLTREV